MSGGSRSQGGVIFEIGTDSTRWFLPASIATKLIPAPRVARVPGGPAELRGVALVDGEMIPVVDVALARLSEAPAAPAPPPRPRESASPASLVLRDAMLVCSFRGESLGLVGLDVVATGFFDVPDPAGALPDSTLQLFDVAEVIARVREGRWAV